MRTPAPPHQKKIRILIADDHPLVREGLVSIMALADDMKVVGEARDGEEACRFYDELLPDILILDLRMPRKDGLEVIRELMSRRVPPRIIVLTTSDKVQDLRSSLILGAKGYVLKDAQPQEVWNTIREVFAGKSSLPPDVAAYLAESMTQPSFSQRELQVLRQMALGKSNKEIATVLFISEHTVKNYVKVVLKKLNATSRTEASVVAHQWGLFEY